MGTQDTGQRQTKQQTQHRKLKGQSRMDNPETLATLGTQDTGQRQTKQKTQHRKLKGQSRMDNPEIQQHWVHKTQDKDKQNNKHNIEN